MTNFIRTLLLRIILVSSFAALAPPSARGDDYWNGYWSCYDNTYRPYYYRQYYYGPGNTTRYYNGYYGPAYSYGPNYGAYYGPYYGTPRFGYAPGPYGGGAVRVGPT